MKVTFTDIQWRSYDDNNVFKIDSIKSITLNGMEQGIITIECIAGTFKAPYCNLHFGGGVAHYEIVIPHPYDVDRFLNIAIFENKVCVANAVQSTVDDWFRNICRMFCC